MAKGGHTFHLQRFFIIFGVLFSIAALGIIVYASQKPTNTSSHAAVQCAGISPVFYTKNYLISGPKKINDNLYSYKLTVYINNYCKTPKKWLFDVTNLEILYIGNHDPAWRFLPNGQAGLPLAITLDGLQKRPLVLDLLAFGKNPDFVSISIRASLATHRHIFSEITILPPKIVDIYNSY